MKKSKLIFFNIILIFAICILNFFNINSKSYINNDLIIHYIDVGQGDCILIQVNNKNLLIDSGPSSNRDDLLNYLQKLNIDKFDYIIMKIILEIWIQLLKGLTLVIFTLLK